ncbi:MAG: molybdopterin molybdotransferase MoeA [Nitrososphaerales archaeon]
MPTSSIKYVAVEEYIATIKQEVKARLEVEEAPINSLTGRILAEDITSQTNLPPHAKSLIDGYAVKSEDTADATDSHPAKLKIIGKIELEKQPNIEVKNTEACYIPTGGFMPKGADSAVKVEDVMVSDDDLVTLSAPVQAGEHVTPAGRDVSKDQVVFRRGRKVRSEDIALLTALEIWSIKVVKRLRVAILSVGDELTDRIEATGEKRFAGISLAIASLVTEAGGEPVLMGVVPDDEAAIRGKIREGLDSAEALLTIGGTSKGPKDLVANAIDRSGSPGLILHGIDIVPGRVSGLGVVDGKPIVMMPGLIQSTVVAFYFIALPAIRQICGLNPEPSFKQVQVPIADDVTLRTPTTFRKLLFVKLVNRGGGTAAQPLSKVGEASLMKPVADADGFIVLPARVTSISRGEYVTVNLLHT